MTKNIHLQLSHPEIRPFKLSADVFLYVIIIITVSYSKSSLSDLGFRLSYLFRDRIGEMNQHLINATVASSIAAQYTDYI